MEIEENGKIPFLDCLVIRGKQQQTTCNGLPKANRNRQTSRRIILQRYFSQSSDFTDLDKTARLVCDSPDSFADEIKYLDNILIKKKYNNGFVRSNTYKNSKPNVTNTDATPVTTATMALLRLSHRSYSTPLQDLQHPCSSQTYHYFATAHCQT